MGAVPENAIIHRTVDPGLPGTPTALAPYLFVGHIPGFAGTVGDVLRITNAVDLAALGLSTMTEAAATYLKTAGGPIFVQPLDGSNAGSITANAGNPNTDVTITGSAQTKFGVAIEITEAGSETTAKYRYSLDTYDEVYPDFSSPLLTTSRVRTATATASSLPASGLSVTFSAGAYTVGQKWRFSAMPAASTGADLTSFAGQIDDLDDDISVIVAPDRLGTSANVQALIASLGAIITTLGTENTFTRGMVSGADSDTAQENADGANATSSKTITWIYAQVLVPASNSIEGYGFALVPFTSQVAARSGVVTPDTDLSRFATGALDEILFSTYDNRKSKTFDDVRVCSPRTYKGSPGFYVANCAYLSDTLSDFDLWPMGRVFDLGAVISRDGVKKYLGESLNTNPNDVPSVGDVGTITEAEAQGIEGDLNSLLKSGMIDPPRMNGKSGYCSAVRFEVDRHYNVLSNKKLLTRLFIRPVAYAKEIEIVQSFTLESI